MIFDELCLVYWYEAYQKASYQHKDYLQRMNGKETNPVCKQAVMIPNPDRNQR